MTLNLAETSVVKSWPSVPHGANIFCCCLLSRITCIWFCCITWLL